MAWIGNFGDLLDDSENERNTMGTFGERLGSLRTAADMGLREFCLTIDMPPSDYSRMERGIVPAPQDHQELEPIRKALGISAEGGEWNGTLRLADLSRKMISPRILSTAEVMAKMPAIICGSESLEMTDERAEELMRMVRRVHEYAPGEAL